MASIVPLPGPPALALPGTGIVRAVAGDAVRLFFSTLVSFVARIDLGAVGLLARAVSATTKPVFSGPSFRAEFATMAVIAAAVMLPLVCVAAIQAIARQDPAGLLRTVFVRVPLALLLTGVVVELVSIGLELTDDASAAVAASAGGDLGSLFGRIGTVLAGPNPVGIAANLLALVLLGLVAFAVFIELAVRAAAVAVATLFLPLALAGSALPATAHWPRRLAETLVALVASKLVIVAVLVLAAGALADAGGGASSLVEGIALFGLAAVAPLALARLLPMVEAGAVSHLDGLGRHAVRQGARLAAEGESWVMPAMAGEAAPSAAAPSGGTGIGLREQGPVSPMPPPPPARPTPSRPGVAGDDEEERDDD